MSSSTDIRVKFLAKETEEVINSLVGLTQRLLLGSNNTCCAWCKTSLKLDKTTIAHTKYIFVVVTDYHNVADETLKFCCLRCVRHQNNVMDVMELYPTLSLHTVKKLMYFNIIKKLFFNFKDSQVIHYKKYVIVDSLNEVLQQVLVNKNLNDEILRLRLVNNETNEIVSENTIDDLRIEFGNATNNFTPKHRFDTPFMLNDKYLIHTVNNNNNKFYIEVYYKEYSKFAPFVVYYDTGYQNECLHCVNKIDVNSGHPIMYCGICGPTNPNYFRKRNAMMVPFWRADYDHKKVYWKWCATRKKIPATNIMLYSVNTKREPTR
ncbi:me-53 [Psilogramma increta granulovirus]|uniref:Me-53 n=1 Tax=Psilogramma increta granulovirus TaxID=2953508 RepID=A0A977XW03_9BBAC|nr:me-53 [Psilogramma increta granulovirus]